MSTPNFADVMADVAAILKLPDEIEIASSPANGYADRIEDAIETLEGEFTHENGVNDLMLSDRTNLATILSQAAISTKMEAILPQVGVAIDTPSVKQDDVSPDDLWADLYDYMTDNAETVTTRNFTFGTPPAITGTGNGRLVRLTVDEEGKDLEGWFADTWTLTCETDARGGGRIHQEAFLLRGTDSASDELRRTGTGVEVQLLTTSRADARRFVKNPSWDNFSGTGIGVGSPGQPTAVSGWTFDSGGFTNTEIDLDIVYRGNPDKAVPASLRLTDNETLRQDLVVVNATTIDFDLPYFVRYAVYRRDTADGTLTVTLGGAANNISRATTINTLGDNAWTIVDLVTTPADHWPKAWNDNDLELVFAYAGRTTGSIHLDDLIFAPFVRVGARGDQRTGRGAMGTYMIVDGGDIPFVKGDTLSFTDTEPGPREGAFNYWFAIAGRGYLPHDVNISSTVPFP